MGLLRNKNKHKDKAKQKETGNEAKIKNRQENREKAASMEGATDRTDKGGEKAPEQATGAKEAEAVAFEAEGEGEAEGKEAPKGKRFEIPTLEQLEAELGREKYRWRFRRVLRSTVYALITVAAAAVLVATLWMPVLQISGSSMSPTLTDGEIVISLKGSDFQPGDIIAFYYDNKILIKRVIAGPGDWVDIDEEGTVYVNEQELYEPYLEEKAFGDCNILLPYQVPESKIFVMGDHRSVSMDSRNTALGCVSDDQIVGRLMVRIWPLNAIGVM